MKRQKLDEGEKFLKSQGMLNRDGFPKTSLYVLWRDGEPMRSTKSDEDVCKWERRGKGFWATVIRPQRKNPSGRQLRTL